MVQAVEYRSGFVAIVGEPNVGKSTLINALVGEKVAIVAPKPQTTPNRIIGVKTTSTAQIVFVDTPGVRIEHEPLAKALTRTSFGALEGADAVLFRRIGRATGSARCEHGDGRGRWLSWDDGGTAIVRTGVGLGRGDIIPRRGTRRERWR
jgi:GTPase SAR1 family protein